MGLGLLCGMCCCPINDRFLLKIMDVSYHENCVQCCVCGTHLHNTCFVKNSKLYCKSDYERHFIKKCLGCSERIASEDIVMRASENIFHLRCFICVVCGVRLQKGDLYVVKQGQLFCRLDYEKEVEMMQGFSTHGEFVCEDILPSSRLQDGRRGPKRPRTILTTQQRRAFKASFEVSPKPCRKVRETLAKDTGLSVRIVQVWFQNQRAKMKKIQKKARQENKNDKDSEFDEKKVNVKEEEQSPHSTPFYADSCSDTENTGEGDNFLYSKSISIKNEIEDNSFFKSKNIQTVLFPDIERKRDDDYVEMNFPLAFDSKQQEIIMKSSIALQNNNSCVTSGINPIDRLYSMQNSYFCSEDEPLMES